MLLEPMEAGSQHPGRILTWDLCGVKERTGGKSFTNRLISGKRELKFKAVEWIRACLDLCIGEQSWGSWEVAGIATCPNRQFPENFIVERVRGLREE